MSRTAPTYSRVTRKLSKSVSSQEKWQFCCFWHFWPRDRRISNLKSRFSEWAPQVHPTDEVSGQKSDFIKKFWLLGSKSRIKLGQGFRFSQNSQNMLRLRSLGELEVLILKNDFSNSKSACHVVKNAKNSKIVIFLGWRPILKIF